MANRECLLSARFTPDSEDQLLLELDLRDVFAAQLLGRHGQLQFLTKLVFKGEDAYRHGESVFRIWADVRVSGQDGRWLPELGRAQIPDPVFFGPGIGGGGSRDPWTRAVDRLTVDIDHRQLEEIEQKRDGGQLTFTFTVGGVVQHAGRIATLYPSINQLTYTIGASTWVEQLSQLAYGTYLDIEVPLTTSDGMTGPVQKAAQALGEALSAFRRGEYEEAVADCRPGLEALQARDGGRFSIRPWDPAASKEERFYWIQRSLLTVTNLAHHPNDPPESSDAGHDASARRWGRADAEAAITLLASIVRWRLLRE